MDIKVDSKTHDFVLSGNDLVYVPDGIEDVAQSVRIRLLTLKSEWFLDDTIGWLTFKGMPFGKGANVNAIRARVLKEILDTPGILSASITEVRFDSRRRNLAISYRAQSTNGPVVDVVNVTTP